MTKPNPTRAAKILDISPWPGENDGTEAQAESSIWSEQPVTTDMSSAHSPLSMNSGPLPGYHIWKGLNEQDRVDDYDGSPDVEYYPKWVRVTMLIGGSVALWMAALYAGGMR